MHMVRYREAMDDNTTRVDKQVTEKNLSYLFTKIMTASRRRLLLGKLTY